jgi:hypothetical protein
MDGEFAEVLRKRGTHRGISLVGTAQRDSVAIPKTETFPTSSGQILGHENELNLHWFFIPKKVRSFQPAALPGPQR